MPGKKLHTGRSRNDQVALDMKLYVRDEIDEIDASSKNAASKFFMKVMEENTAYLYAWLYPSAESSACNTGSSCGSIF